MPRCQRFHQLAAVSLFAIASAVLSPRAALGGERGLTLDGAIRLSLAGPRLRAVRESVNQARADLRTASSVPNPSLSVEVGMLPLSRRYTVDQPGGPTELSGGMSYAVDWLLFGKRAAAVASAEAGVGVAQAEYADIVRRRATETAEAFYSVLEAQALLEVARHTLGDMEQAEAAIRKAAASGGRSQVELSRVRLELESVRREERFARSAVSSAKATLAAFLGELPTATPLEVSGTLDGPLVAKPLSVGTAFAVAAEKRADIMALRRRVAQARRNNVVENRNAWPETTLGVGVAHQFQRSIGAPDVTAWGANIEVALPLFDRNQGNRDKAASLAVQSTLELTAALAELRAEVEQAVESLSTALENAAGVAETELELASQVRDSFRKAYEAGGGTLIEMIDAQRSCREVRRAYITTRADYWRSLFRYEASLGSKVSP